MFKDHLADFQDTLKTSFGGLFGPSLIAFSMGPQKVIPTRQAGRHPIEILAMGKVLCFPADIHCRQAYAF